MIKRVGYFVVCAALLVGACSEGDDLSVNDERPDTVAHADFWMYRFTSLEELTATATLVVAGEVTAVERGRTMHLDDPPSLTVRDVTITIAETFKGTAPGATVIIEESGHRADGTSFEIDVMPWSRVGDRGVYFLSQNSALPDDRYVQLDPDGRILTHHHVDGQSQPYETAQVFSHTALGEALGELAPDSVASRVRQAAATVVSENIQPQKSIPERLAELEDEENRGGTDIPSADSSSTAPATRG